MPTNPTSPDPVKRKLQGILDTDGLLTGAEAHFLYQDWVDIVTLLEQTPLWQAKMLRAKAYLALQEHTDAKTRQGMALHLTANATERLVMRQRRTDYIAVALERQSANLLNRLASHYEAAEQKTAASLSAQEAAPRN